MDNSQPNYTVQPGLLVQVEVNYQDESERLVFVIVPEEQADFKAGFLGESTPLARAILGEKSGAEIPYFSGDARSVRILSISPTDISPADDTAERRAQKMRAAIQQVERTNAVIFASSFSGKWGDYDPQGIEAWESGASPEETPPDQ